MVVVVVVAGGDRLEEVGEGEDSEASDWGHPGARLLLAADEDLRDGGGGGRAGHDGRGGAGVGVAMVVAVAPGRPTTVAGGQSGQGGRFLLQLVEATVALGAAVARTRQVRQAAHAQHGGRSRTVLQRGRACQLKVPGRGRGRLSDPAAPASPPITQAIPCDPHYTLEVFSSWYHYTQRIPTAR